MYHNWNKVHISEIFRELKCKHSNPGGPKPLKKTKIKKLTDEEGEPGKYFISLGTKSCHYNNCLISTESKLRDSIICYSRSQGILK